MLSRDSDDENWSRFVFELVIWPQEVTLIRWTQSSGQLCLWQCFLSWGGQSGTLTFFWNRLLTGQHLANSGEAQLKESPCSPWWKDIVLFHLAIVPLALSTTICCANSFLDLRHVQASGSVGWAYGVSFCHEAKRFEEIHADRLAVRAAVDSLAKEVFRSGEKGAGQQQDTTQPVNRAGMYNEFRYHWKHKI